MGRARAVQGAAHDRDRFATFSVRAGLAEAAGRGAGLVQLRRSSTGAGAPSVLGERCPGHAELEHVVYARDGLTMPCCSVWAGYDTPALGLGDWRARPLSESVAVHDHDPYFRLVADAGFEALYARIHARDPEVASRLVDPRAVGNACELCARLMKSPDAARIRALCAAE